MRVSESCAIKQVGRNGLAGADEGFAVDVRVRIERPVSRNVLGGVEAEDDDVDVCLAACIGAPRECLMRV